jgi:hypothetical protein
MAKSIPDKSMWLLSEPAFRIHGKVSKRILNPLSSELVSCLNKCLVLSLCLGRHASGDFSLWEENTQDSHNLQYKSWSLSYALQVHQCPTNADMHTVRTDSLP